MRITDTIRIECARIAEAALSVRINSDRIPAYARELAPHLPPPTAPAGKSDDREDLAAYWLTLDAINFGSGWFPTLRKQPGETGYRTIAGGLRRRFEIHGPWPSDDLADIGPAELAGVFGQEPGHELMALFSASLRDLGSRITDSYGSSFASVADRAAGSAVHFVETLAAWACFRDSSSYRDREVPFLKRAQIAAADLHRAGVVSFGDLRELTLFADNLVPHVLRLDGIVEFAPELVARIERGDLIEHGSPEEVEIRACALHAVELLVAASPSPATAMQFDECLWTRGQLRSYKARPRHRARTTAY